MRPGEGVANPANDCRHVAESNTAYQWGVPDGTVSMTSHAANVALAAFGDVDRAEKQPWIPLFMTGKKAVEAVVGGPLPVL